jgi:nicotinamidase-related amidase
VLRKTSALVVTIAIITALSLGLAGGCAPEAKPSAEVEGLKSQLAAAVIHSEKAAAQLDYVTGQLSAANAEYKELGTLVPPAVEPEAVTIDPSKTALIIVDMQNDFLLLGGKLGPTTEAGASACAEYTSRIKALLDKCRDAGMPVVYTQDYHHPDDPEFAIWPPHCVVGTSGQEEVSELTPEAGDYVLHKGGKTVSYDCFYASYEPNEMENTLASLGVDTVIVTGTVSNICVYCAVVGCAQRGYETIVPKDCILSLAPSGERLALFQFSALYGVVVTQSDMITFK